MPDEDNIANLPVLYTNSVRLGMAFSDIRLFFGEGVPIGGIPEGPPGQITSAPGTKHIDRICIVLSPDLIPALAEGLKRAAEQYQVQFGPLRQMPQPPAPPQAAPEVPQNPIKS